MLSQILALNLSHNQLTGHIPVNLSKLKNMESLDLSFNSLTGEVPPELIKLNSLAVLNVSYNNLSGRLPEMKAQFSTFTKESYEGNPFSVVHHWRKIAPLNQR
ncbi:putative non-specific serine/threonine protein kinase [Helianthus annuus]|nr:putative non-specific serine/threonine protein kinase [Helianthus annuus]